MENTQNHSGLSQNKNSFQDSVNEAGNVACKVGEEVRKGAQDMGSAVRDFTTQACTQLKASPTFQRVSETARDATSTIDRQVRSNPFTALGVAFGLGVLLSSMMRR